MPYRFTLIFLLSWLGLQAVRAQGTPGREKTFTSVLSSGSWYKIGITGSGLYKLDKNFLQSLGLPVESLDPRNLQLYGNGGAMLPQLNQDYRPDDLVQNSVFVAGEADSRLEANDYLLFYAPGPHRWHFNEGVNRFEHVFNLYSDTAYYFLTLGSVPGRRVQTQAPAANPTQVIDTYQERLFHEQDLVNVLQSGREWYGESFNSFNLSRTISFSLPDLVPNSPVQLTASLMSGAGTSSRFEIKAGNQVLGSQSFPGVGSHDYHAAGQADVQTYPFPAAWISGNSLPVTLTFSVPGATEGSGYLNYLEVNAERQLKMLGNQTAFRSTRFLGSNQVAAYRVSGLPPGSQVWEVTQPLKPRAHILGQQSGAGNFTARTDSLREFVAFAGTDFPRPVPFGRVANQNLHNLNKSGTLDMVILTHPLFLTQAEQLAQHRRQHDNFEVAVVTSLQIYQEFSSGSQDITAIRDFMKMVYDRRAGDRKMYLLLFGDASYDYKTPPLAGKGRTPNNTNFVPVYESRESLDPLSSYSSEDFFGFLNNEEGTWSETSFNTPELLDIGIGRLPVKNAAEASAVVAKIIHYDSPLSYGKWRNRVTLVADDGDGSEHLRDAESLAALLTAKDRAYVPRKIYLDLYKQQSQPNGQRSPGTNTDLNQAVEQGSLVVNYTGHGNETSLAHEQILTLPQIQAWKNLNRLTFLFTATCAFGRYDDPKQASGAEAALLNPEGGAIGLLTTTRPVYASTNRILNRNFFNLAFDPVQQKTLRLGDLTRLTKNNSLAQTNNRNFTLLGDPSQRLAYPGLSAQLTHVNNNPVAAGQRDTLRALEPVTLTGTIQDAHNMVKTDFTGLIEITVLDKPSQIKTLGDESSPLEQEQNKNIHEIRVNENKVYAGKATVKDGKWEVTFILPKDISYFTGPGEISLYAYNNQDDAQGYSDAVYIGGTATQAPADVTPPRIRLFMDDLSFVSGNLTGAHPTLLAHLSDDSGINTSGSGIGHEITAILDGNHTNTFILNDYYSASQDDFRQGEIRFPVKGLLPGNHELVLKAWDTYNNSGEALIRFRVSSEGQLELADVKNFPNPFGEKTTFQFDHNQGEENLDIQILVFAVTGKLVKRINRKVSAGDSHLPSVIWDGKDDLGMEVRNGIYLYQIFVRSEKNGLQAGKVNKLIKLK